MINKHDMEKQTKKRTTGESDERVFLTKEEALSLMEIQSDGSVHNQKNSGMMLIGCDWSKKSVSKALDNAETIEIGGKICKAMGHAIVVIPKGAKYQNEILFFAHNKDKVAAFED